MTRVVTAGRSPPRGDTPQEERAPPQGWGREVRENNTENRREKLGSSQGPSLGADVRFVAAL